MLLFSGDNSIGENKNATTTATSVDSAVDGVAAVQTDPL